MKRLCILALLLGGCSAQQATVAPTPQIIVVVATPTPVGGAAPGAPAPAGANMVAAPTLVPPTPKPTISTEEQAWLDNFGKVTDTIKVNTNLPLNEQAASFRGNLMAAKQLYNSLPVPSRFQKADGLVRQSFAEMDEAGIHMQNQLTNNTQAEADAAQSHLAAGHTLMGQAFDAVDEVLKASK